MLSNRIYYDKFIAIKEKFPIICVLGARQCGKTTFAKSFLQGYEYLDLEKPSDMQKIKGDPEGFLLSRKTPVILDEVQCMPELFPILRALVDEEKKNGKYVLLGSTSFLLIQGISESLAGRVAFIDMSPFLLPEIKNDFHFHWLKGGFPNAFLAENNNELAFDWFENYTRTLIERDLPALGIEINPIQFRQLWTMCAHSSANILNKNKLAAAIGISPHTIERYLYILEQSFLIRRLPPYFTNIKKRTVKSPKLYIRDSGLLHYFLSIHNTNELWNSPYRGDSFESYVIEQILGITKLTTPEYEAFYLHTSDEYEIDLLLVRGSKKIAIEIKTSLAFDNKQIKKMEKINALVHPEKFYIINPGDDKFSVTKNIECIGLGYWIKSNFKKFW